MTAHRGPGTSGGETGCLWLIAIVLAWVLIGIWYYATPWWPW